MPSRKKAQGKARKAKQAAKAEVNPSLGFSNGEKNWSWSREDYDAATSLWHEYIDKCNEIGRVLFARSSDQHLLLLRSTVRPMLPTINIINLVMLERSCSRRMILGTGTQLCLVAAKENDLTKETGVAYSACSIIMIVTIEMREKYNLAQNIDIP